jgi:hypothetical protein
MLVLAVLLELLTFQADIIVDIEPYVEFEIALLLLPNTVFV